MRFVVITRVDEHGFPLECREYDSFEAADADAGGLSILNEHEYRGYKMAMDQYHGDKKPRPKRKWWKLWGKA